MATLHNSGPRPQLCLPPHRQTHWQAALPDQLEAMRPGPVDLMTQHWTLHCRELNQLQELLLQQGFSIGLLHTHQSATAISAQALGIPVHLSRASHESAQPLVDPNQQVRADTLRLHRGTLRSGDQLETSGSLLVLGDVNPGATVCAGGDVMVWGRLRGIAHAGRNGDIGARIVALQLRPLQLRIADQVARGPDDQPQPGLAEEARIEGDEIVIEAADPRLNAALAQRTGDAAGEQSLA